MKLWLFGHSLCLPFGLENELGWGDLLAQDLGAELINLAQPGVDNFYIYYCYQRALTHIAPEDYVVIGWSHYSRKLFVVDINNAEHAKVVGQSLTYNSPGVQFMRNGNAVTGDATKWLTMRPQDRGVPFYDIWYRDYYSELEQKFNFQSYLDSVKFTCPGKYLPFYFSKETTEGINIDDNHGGFVTEFIIENNYELIIQVHYHSKLYVIGLGFGVLQKA
jgi:hypothetical protein